jgi:hypothetical protein
MCQHERMTTESEKIRNYAKLFCMSDSSSKVLHLVSEPLLKVGRKENNEEEHIN